MSRRINIVLPEGTLAVLDRVAPRGNRSAFIARAVLHYVEQQGKHTLRERLKREAIETAARDVAMAADWFALDEEAALPKPVSKKRKPKAA
jgi:CopG family transcriptional regulator/antitoxin EndoAI